MQIVLLPAAYGYPDLRDVCVPDDLAQVKFCASWS